ncbi:MAG TPA: GerMN domain-containing protein [Terriglobales bacterium]|nr:GerMN domain-containing protein [Terriglobales bacterium]
MIPRQFLITVTVLFALTIAMSVYVWQLRRREIRSPQVTEKNEHVAPPTLGPMEQVTVYVAYDSPGELRAQSISIPLAAGRQQRAEGLLRGLMTIYNAKDSTHPVAGGAEIREVFLLDPGLVVIDVNSAFVEGQVSGILAEELTIASLVQTLAANMPELTRVKILVDGKEQETLAGHADLKGFYDVQQIAEMTKQLSAQ